MPTPSTTGRRKCGRRFTDSQYQTLEYWFALDPKPAASFYHEIARLCDPPLTYENVRVWFQNNRQRVKREKQRQQDIAIEKLGASSSSYSPSQSSWSQQSISTSSPISGPVGPLSQSVMVPGGMILPSAPSSSSSSSGINPMQMPAYNPQLAYYAQQLAMFQRFAPPLGYTQHHPLVSPQNHIPPTDSSASSVFSSAATSTTISPVPLP